MASSDPPRRSSRTPITLDQRLIAAIVVALGLGTGGGSLIAGREDPAALQELLDTRAAAQDVKYATKLEMAELSSELALLRQQLEMATGMLQTMGAQLTAVEEATRRPPTRSRR